MVIGKAVDGVLLFFFLIISLAAPLLDTQTVVTDSYPAFLRPLHAFYARTSGDYMFVDTPAFFVGIIWVQLLFQWPLAVACAYGIIAGKPWFGTPCLMYGASLLTTMAAALSEMHLSNKAPDRMFFIYYPFLGFSILAILRGLFSDSGKSITTRKKRV